MKKNVENALLHVKMSDGSVWAVPVREIAYHRAKYYADRDEEFGGDVARSLREDTLPLFESDEYEIKDWATSNMNWEDIENPILVSGPAPVDYQDGWLNGEKDIVYPKGDSNVKN